MSALIHCVTVESDDPYALASWWAGVLDRRLHDDDHPGDPEAVLVAPDGHGPDLLFVEVGERHGKGAFHIDLHPADRTRDAEVERLLGLGAALVADRRRPDGTGWVVLADPEGNEFCVCRSAAERAVSA
ncbi:Glyoxalase-like domain [Micromonospora rhizosphaerae]|uniref:Glyoxalase-like domain n=1 Tax=Micromonospora rhizosphaerae TaxID=568872 RepID=A0A1C6RYB5_9ACTN|nr:VOC family protein [Micromonospora rhizosphaerae]SCL22209.1 Glyoxalase-like domain [Micromonospora rhizosphaerae]